VQLVDRDGASAVAVAIVGGGAALSAELRAKLPRAQLRAHALGLDVRLDPASPAQATELVRTLAALGSRTLAGRTQPDPSGPADGCSTSGRALESAKLGAGTVAFAAVGGPELRAAVARAVAESAWAPGAAPAEPTPHNVVLPAADPRELSLALRLDRFGRAAAVAAQLGDPRSPLSLWFADARLMLRTATVSARPAGACLHLTFDAPNADEAAIRALRPRRGRPPRSGGRPRRGRGGGPRAPRRHAERHRRAASRAAAHRAAGGRILKR
jgi:hypothetical protein